MTKFLVYLLFPLMIIGRILIEPRLDLPTATGSYEAVVHLYVGWLLGAWWVSRKIKSESAYLWMAILLTIFEVVMFVYQKG